MRWRWGSTYPVGFAGLLDLGDLALLAIGAYTAAYLGSKLHSADAGSTGRASTSTS